MIGRTINHYKIIKPLGKGGMGEVYEAEDTRLKRNVALKVLPEEMAADLMRLDRFQHEAEAIAALNHPNVVTIYSVEQAGNIRFLTMELVEGRTLCELISPNGMDLESYFRIAIPVAAALAAAHEKDIVHRDLKPANIMITADGRVKILDFGLAKFHRIDPIAGDSQIETKIKTEVGVVLGTMPYMSPEQLQGKIVDHRTDIFSLGIVFYEMIMGCRPFQGDSAANLISSILRDTPVFISDLKRNVPEHLSSIIQRCLEKDPNERYQTSRDVYMELQSVCGLRLSSSDVSQGKERKPPVHNLPVQVTAFVGRKKELAELKALILSHPLITLTGTGGSGKTRLAFEAALRSMIEFPDGVWQVSLAPISSPDLVVSSIVDVLQVNKQPDRSPIEIVTTEFRNRKVLLIIDNCEHVLEESAKVVGTILRTCPQVRIVATSREALNVAGEYVWAVPALSFPVHQSNLTVASAKQCDAVNLFVERACARDIRFTLNQSNVEAVADICARLDGIPLAIELAAARIKVISASEIRERLNDCFNLLTLGSRGSVPRHQTLRAAVDWSHDLLEPDERILFRRISIFTGGFELEALERVCARRELNALTMIDRLTRLVDKSLVLIERTADDEVRYRLLEPIRLYAEEKLNESGERDEIAQSHFAHYTDLADRAYDERIESSASWLIRLERDHDNLRSALVWASQNDPEGELRLAGALAWFWATHSHFSEGRRSLRHALARTGDRTFQRARALCGASSLAAFQGDHEESEPASEGLAIWRELGNQKEVALALESIGWNHFFTGNSLGALDAFEESFAIQKELGDERHINRATLNICQVLVAEFNVERAEPMARKCLSVAIENDEPRDIHFAYHFLADCDLIRGDVVAARAKYADSLNAAIRLGDRIEITFEIEGIAMSLAGMGRDVKAMRLLGAVQAEHEAMKSTVAEIPFWKALKDRYFLPAESRLGAQAVEAEKRVGRSIGFEAAVQYGLAVDSD
jgi:non-specific serine/threonine protein kinase